MFSRYIICNKDNLIGEEYHVLNQQNKNKIKDILVETTPFLEDLFGFFSMPVSYNNGKHMVFSLVRIWMELNVTVLEKIIK